VKRPLLKKNVDTSSLEPGGGHSTIVAGNDVLTHRSAGLKCLRQSTGRYEATRSALERRIETGIQFLVDD